MKGHPWIAALFALALVACGGDPFTEALFFESGSDADAGNADTGRIGLPQNDAADHADAGSLPDTASPVDARADVVTCTPLTPWTCSVATNPPAPRTINPPYYCVWSPPCSQCGPDGGTGPSSLGQGGPTPPECRCQETYTCACILAAIPDPCGNGVHACQQSDRGPVIQCF